MAACYADLELTRKMPRLQIWIQESSACEEQLKSEMKLSTGSMQNQKEQKQIAKKHHEEEDTRKETENNWSEMQQTTTVCTKCQSDFQERRTD